MSIRKILSAIFFFIIGVIILLKVYKNFDFEKLGPFLKGIKYEWIILSIPLGLLSHYIRAIRWRMLINTMNYDAGNLNLFLSVIILYFTNLFIPRGGEIMRCVIISRYENVPIAKLAGTVFIERLSDLFTFVIIFLLLVILQFNFFKTVFAYPGFVWNLSSVQNKWMTILFIIIVISAITYLLTMLKIFDKIKIRIKRLFIEFIEGFSVVLHLRHRVIFLLYTFLIYFIWLIMLYAIFLAFPPTRELHLLAAVLTYTIGTLAFLLPIQAGIGAWHFLIINCLFFYGIDKETGMMFALIAYTFTSLIFVILGPIALAILPFLNKNFKKNNYKIK
jgi:glycosyltransferase 2 family protein